MNDQDITTIIPRYWYLAKLCDSRQRISTQYDKYTHDDKGNIKKDGKASGEEHIHVAWSCEIQHVRGGRLCEGTGKTPKEAIQAACAQARLKYPQTMPDYEEEIIEKYDAENDILTIIEKIEPNKIFSTWNHGIQICKSFDDERIVGIRILNLTSQMEEEVTQPATKYDKEDDTISIQLQREPVCIIEIGNALIYQTINTKQITGIRVTNLSKIMAKP